MDFKKRELWLNVTQDCNMKCKYCINRSKEIKSNKLDLGTIKRVIREYNNLSDDGTVVITGGEPLVRKDIIDILNYSKKFEIEVCLDTNGTLIDKDMAEKIVEASVDYVGISLDAPKKIQNKLYQGALYEKIVNGVKNLKREEEGNMGIYNLSLLCQKNKNYIEEITIKSIKLGFDSIYFQPLFPGAKEFYRKNKLRPEDYEIADEILRLKEKYSKYIGFNSDSYLEKMGEFIREGERNFGCGGLSSYIHINSQGEIFPCPFSYDFSNSERFKLGNINNMKLEDIDPKTIPKEELSRKSRCKKCFYLIDQFTVIDGDDSET